MAAWRMAIKAWLFLVPAGLPRQRFSAAQIHSSWRVVPGPLGQATPDQRLPVFANLGRPAR